MAVVSNFNNNTNDNTQQAGNAMVNKPISVSGSSAAPTLTGNAPASSTGTSQAPTIGAGTSNNSNPTKSGSFTNLQNYLGANSNYNAQGGGLAGQMNNNFSKQSNVVQGNLNKAQTSFNDAANQGKIDYNGDLVNQAVSDPTSFVQNQNNLNSFLGQANATYTGPTQLDSTGNLKNQASNLQGSTNLTGSETGRFALLNSMFGTPQYNNGEQRLDNAFLQGNAGQMNTLNQSRNISAQLTNNINNANAQAQQTAANNAQYDANTASQTKNAINNAVNAQEQALTDKANKLNTDYASQYAALKTQLGNGQVSKSFADANGLAPNQLLYGLNPADYLQQSLSTPATVANVATDADNSRFQALSQLAQDPTLAAYATPGTAAPTTPYTFDSTAFQQALAAREHDLNSILNKGFSGQPYQVGSQNAAPGSDLASLLNMINASGNTAALTPYGFNNGSFSGLQLVPDATTS